MAEVTGLNYSNSDLTLEQIEKFISQTEKLGSEKNCTVFDFVQLSGGEPLLHPNIVEIVQSIKERLLDKELARSLIVNSNLVFGAPTEVKPYLVNYSSVQQKPKEHAAVLLHPDDRGCPRPTFKDCTYHGKNRVVLTYQGYSYCCVSDGYIRLFGEEDLIVGELPSSPEGFPAIDRVCQHCSFGCKIEKLEKDVGRPVSKIYAEQAGLNRRGRPIKKIF
jgi:hypothetical protein